MMMVTLKMMIVMMVGVDDGDVTDGDVVDGDDVDYEYDADGHNDGNENGE